MGIKGTVRRTTDGHLIHANIDTDIIISEEPPTGSTKKPEELYQVIERFAQGGHHCSGVACLMLAYGGQCCCSRVYAVWCHVDCPLACQACSWSQRVDMAQCAQALQHIYRMLLALLKGACQAHHIALPRSECNCMSTCLSYS